MTTPADWRRDAVIYQIYLRSFADGNGDGIGDIAGVVDRLDYLAGLGVDAIWFSPWYRSPFVDGGYDVEDHRAIDPVFGTVDEAIALIDAAHECDLKVILDFVPNHTSSRHVWFQEALTAPRGDPARERYHIRPGRGEAGSIPPTNWISSFGGPAWSQLPDGDWYLHLFDKEQPDLNWSNPEVQDHYDDVLRFWLDRGVDGFRVDVPHALVKDPEWTDLTQAQLEAVLADGAAGLQVGNHPHWDRDGVHAIIRQWRRVLDEYGARLLVGEAWVQPDRLPLYTRPDEFDVAFNFPYLECTWNARAFREAIATSAKAEPPQSGWVLANHDVMRHTTRYGLGAEVDHRSWLAGGQGRGPDQNLGMRRARAAILMTLGLPGVVCLYQGEELGLPEVWDLPPEVLDDPIWERSGHRDKGRDGCRVPLPWTTESPALGFSRSPGWLPQPPEFASLAVSVQADDPGSILQLYKTALALRRSLADTPDLDVLLGYDDDVVAYMRGSRFMCIVNMGDQPVNAPDHEVMLSSDPLPSSKLPPDTAAWFRLDPQG